MPAKKGDFVKVDYTGKLIEGTIFDTTNADEAKNANIYSEKGKYGPVLLIIGKGHAIAGLDEAIEGMEVNQEKNVSIPPEKGFGQRNTELLKVVPISRFKDEKVEPAPGLMVNIDNRAGIIKSVSGGRVVVDFNHPLAGQDLEYKVKLVAILGSAQEKVQAILEESELKGSVSVEGDVAVANVKADTSSDYFIKKQTFLNWMTEVSEIKKVKVNEEYEIAELKKPAK